MQVVVASLFLWESKKAGVRSLNSSTRTVDSVGDAHRRKDGHCWINKFTFFLSFYFIVCFLNCSVLHTRGIFQSECQEESNWKGFRVDGYTRCRIKNNWTACNLFTNLILSHYVFPGKKYIVIYFLVIECW